MSCCGNTMALGMPYGGNMNTLRCNSNLCSGSGAGGGQGACQRQGLGPRKKREKTKEHIRDYILNMLGAPTIEDLELDEQNIDFAIEQALKVFEDYAPMEYYSYYTFYTVPGKSVYEMPPDIGMIRSVEYKNMGTFSFQASDLDGVIPIEYFYPGGLDSMQAGMLNPTQPIWGKAADWTVFKMYERLYSKMASGLGGWEWIGGYRHIKLYPTPCGGQKVGVRYIQKCKDWEDATDAMQVGALTYAKEILGRIRGRFKNPPGPNGGLQMDGDQLIQEAREDREKWKEDLIWRYGDPQLPITYY